MKNCNHCVTPINYAATSCNSCTKTYSGKSSFTFAAGDGTFVLVIAAMTVIGMLINFFS